MHPVVEAAKRLSRMKITEMVVRPSSGGVTYEQRVNHLYSHFPKLQARLESEGFREVMPQKGRETLPVPANFPQPLPPMSRVWEKTFHEGREVHELKTEPPAIVSSFFVDHPIVEKIVFEQVPHETAQLRIHLHKGTKIHWPSALRELRRHGYVVHQNEDYSARILEDKTFRHLADLFFKQPFGGQVVLGRDPAHDEKLIPILFPKTFELPKATKKLKPHKKSLPHK